MSTETILSRMMSEPAFADAVFANADKALAEYKLPAEDLAKFKGLSRAEFTSMSPEERKSFSVVIEFGKNRDSDVAGQNRRGPNGQGTQHNETTLTI